ncbi:MAG: hypothetical protein KGJ06_09100 [Pseudomonadota bacterium]|nr:hypothetical protein [Pseudomonadota bacterium]
MSIWLLHLPLTAEEEAHLTGRTHLPLPIEDVPDLSLMMRPVECRHLLQALHPEEPPEAISRRLERIWRLYTGVHAEDIIAVPLPARGELALAEVTGKYQYQVGEGGEDHHRVPVTWHRPILLRRFRKFKELLVPGGEKMHEIASAPARIAIRDTLPHRYNRFARWKWLLALFFLLGMLRALHRLAMTLYQ